MIVVCVFVWLFWIQSAIHSSVKIDLEDAKMDRVQSGVLVSRESATGRRETQAGTKARRNQAPDDMTLLAQDEYPFSYVSR